MRLGERLLVALLGLIVFGLCHGIAGRTRGLQADILIDVATGAVLAARNADEPVIPASLTKMMTLYLTFRAIESGQLELDRASRSPGGRLRCRRPSWGSAGSTIQVEDAILGLVTRSANDAATVLAEALGGSEDRFAAVMTRTARRLGMTRTVFRNASGLPDGEQRTTARDLARLATRLIADYPGYYRYFSRRSFSYAGRTHGNHNRLLAAYPGMDGLKTGYTRASGFNLAASAVRDGRRLVGGGDRRALPPERATPPWWHCSTTASPTRGLGASIRPWRLPPPRWRATRWSHLRRRPSGAVRTRSSSRAWIRSPTPWPWRSRPSDRSAADVERAATRPNKLGKAAKQAAKTKPAAKKRGLAQPYGVQVGAFQKSKQARNALAVAMRRAPDLLRGTMVSVGSSQSRNGAVFRATLVGLSKADADSVCRRLKKQRQDCLVVRTSPVEMATR